MYGMSHFLPLPHCRVFFYSEMYGTLLLPEVKYLYSHHHKCFSVQQCQKCLGILFGFIYISLNAGCAISSYVEDFYRIYQ